MYGIRTRELVCHCTLIDAACGSDRSLIPNRLRHSIYSSLDRRLFGIIDGSFPKACINVQYDDSHNKYYAKTRGSQTILRALNLASHVRRPCDGLIPRTDFGRARSGTTPK